MKRREFLTHGGLMIGAAAMTRAALAQDAPAAQPPESNSVDDWKAVRAQFNLAAGQIHMAGFFLVSHPAPVREAIERHRLGLDINPIGYHHANNVDLVSRTLAAAGAYLGASPDDIALTDSTTMGLGLLYGAIDLRPGQEILTTAHDHYSTHRSLELRAERTGATVKFVTLYERSVDASVDGMVAALRAAVTPQTRVVALTWVHSCTGVKLPIRAIADALGEINAARDEDDRAVLCVDGVHGLGIENVTLADLGCDVFVAGTHKWLFGPRGTGILWANTNAQPLIKFIIPPFPHGFSGRAGDPPVSAIPWGSLATPGGFHSFEHRWALAEAFEFHQRIGKARIVQRIHALNSQLKDGLASMRHVTLHTPLSDDLSAGIVCFEVANLDPGEIVERLAQKSIVASESPYKVSYARLAPSLLVDEADVETCLREVRALA